MNQSQTNFPRIGSKAIDEMKTADGGIPLEQVTAHIERRKATARAALVARHGDASLPGAEHSGVQS